LRGPNIQKSGVPFGALLFGKYQKMGQNELHLKEGETHERLDLSGFRGFSSIVQVLWLMHLTPVTGVRIPLGSPK